MVGHDDPEIIVMPQIVWTELYRTEKEELATGLWAQLHLERCTAGPETGSYRLKIYVTYISEYGEFETVGHIQSL